MNNEHFKQAEETFKKNVDNSMKWFEETTTLMVDSFNRQITFGFDIYRKWMDTVLKVDENPFKTFEKNFDMFKMNVNKINDLSKDLIKTILDSFSIKNGNNQFKSSVELTNQITEAITEAINNQIKLTVEYNEKYFVTVSKQFRDSEVDFVAFSQKLQKMLENNMEVSRESIKTILETYHKQTNSSAEATEKLLNDINNLIDFMNKGTINYWEELMDVINRAMKTDVKGDVDDRKGKAPSAKKTSFQKETVK